MGEIELGAAAEATIQAYRELATDPAKRLALALDRTCVQFLAYVVADGEERLVLLAIKTLALIAEAKECRPSLANTFGVLEALQSVTEDEENYSEEVRNEAAGLFTSLQFARCVKKSPTKGDDATDKGTVPDEVDSTKSQGEEKPSKSGSVSTPEKSNSGSVSPTRSEVKSESPTKQSDVSESSRRGSSVDGDSRSLSVDEPSKSSKTYSSVDKKSSFLGPGNSKAKIVTLFIKGMVNPEHRKQIEEELVRVRGLISIVFDMGHSRVTCRVKRDLSVEKLAAAVARTDLASAQQVTTNADGEEVMVPLGGDICTSGTTSPVDDLPDYLPEEDNVVKDAKSAMAPSGSFKEAASSWFTAASSLLQKSFYW
ncbi:armadillo repeat-containing protein 1-like [Macrobrachium nipponense]|uniref:armadillo repeat-containing protein 1-like n=1 Tax=Macrobrachium nipponense TaxID=159736 RepID=UPI0030C816F9